MNGSDWNRRDFLRFAGLAVAAAGTVGFAGCGSEDNAAVGAATILRASQNDRAHAGR